MYTPTINNITTKGRWPYAICFIFSYAHSISTKNISTINAFTIEKYQGQANTATRKLYCTIVTRQLRVVSKKKQKNWNTNMKKL